VRRPPHLLDLAGLDLRGPLELVVDGLADGVLGRALADLRDVRTRETMRHLEHSQGKKDHCKHGSVAPVQATRGHANDQPTRSFFCVRESHAHSLRSPLPQRPTEQDHQAPHLRELVHIDIRGHGALAQVRLEDAQSALQIRKRDVHQLVQAARPGDGRVQDIRSVGRADDEDGLLGTHAVDLGQNLVDDTITRLAPAGTAPARLGDRVHLVEEQDARRRRTRLVEELTAQSEDRSSSVPIWHHLADRQHRPEKGMMHDNKEPAQIDFSPVSLNNPDPPQRHGRKQYENGKVRRDHRTARTGRWPPTLRTTW
jgi:hypothetical protein